MKYRFIVLSLLCISLLLASAGCVVSDADSDLPDPQDPAPFADDAIVGIWTGTDSSTFAGSGTGQVKETTTLYRITISDDGAAEVYYQKTEKEGLSSTTNEYMLDSTVSKAENVYTIATPLHENYVITISADGTATLTTPSASVCQLEKQI